MTDDSHPRRRRRANAEQSKRLRRLTEPSDARFCPFCGARFEQRSALDRHLAALPHGEQAMVLLPRGMAARAQLMVGVDGQHRAISQPLTFRHDATSIIVSAANVAISLLARLGLNITSWVAVGHIEGKPPVIVTDKGGIEALPNEVLWLPTLRERHDYLLRLAERRGQEGDGSDEQATP